MKNISWQWLNELEEQYGPSFYLLDLCQFTMNCKEFLKAFYEIYPNTKLAYSYKANYLPRLCQLVDSMGGYAEVVSGMEYKLALQSGVQPQNIIFNGPYKRKSELEEALVSGAVVNLDSPYEIDLVEVIARNTPEKKMTVGLRINFDIGDENISRFGFDLDGDEFSRAITRLFSISNCFLAGLHCHFHVIQRDVSTYELITKKMLRIFSTYFIKGNRHYIDLGGGFFGKVGVDLKRQFPYAIPSYQNYAQAIASQFADAYPNGAGPELILEPGIGITADTMKYVAKVIDIKKVRSRVVALVAGSIHNIKPSKSRINLPVTVYHNEKKPKSTYSDSKIDIVGYTCMEDDCLYSGYNGRLNVDDYVVFENVGAYTQVLKPPYIQPCPAILAYEKADELTVIKRRETFADVFSTYSF